VFQFLEASKRKLWFVAKSTSVSITEWFIIVLHTADCTGVSTVLYICQHWVILNHHCSWVLWFYIQFQCITSITWVASSWNYCEGNWRTVVVSDNNNNKFVLWSRATGSLGVWDRAVLWQDWSQTGLGLGLAARSGLGLSLGLILLVLLKTLLCPTGAVWHDNAEM